MPLKASPTQLDFFADEATVPDLISKAAAKSEPRCTRCCETFLSDHQVAKRYGVSRAAIWRWVNSNPEFPDPTKLSPGTTRWKLSDLVRFELQTERDAKQRLKARQSGASP